MLTALRLLALLLAGFVFMAGGIGMALDTAPKGDLFAQAWMALFVSLWFGVIAFLVLWAIGAFPDSWYFGLAG